MKKKKVNKVKNFLERSDYCVSTCEWIAGKAFDILKKLDELENDKFDKNYNKKYLSYIKELKYFLHKSEKEMKTMDDLEKELSTLKKGQ
jgi:predicted RNA-binding protein with EMAP domain